MKHVVQLTEPGCKGSSLSFAGAKSEVSVAADVEVEESDQEAVAAEVSQQEARL